MGFIANFMGFLAMQKFWESVKMWQSYREFKGGNFFETQCRSFWPPIFGRDDPDFSTADC